MPGPGPKLSKSFTYNGTPPPNTETLPPYMKQTRRFYDSGEIGTHKYRQVRREQIQDNPNNRIGVGNVEINHTPPK